MAASVKISGNTYTYTISNIQNAITCTPGNRNSRYGSVYACPTVTRNKTGEAFTRYFMYEVSGASSGQTLDYEIALYKAVFTKTGKTATVTEVTSESVATLGRLAYVKINRTWSPSLVVSAGTSASSFWDNASTSVSITLSGWNPATPSISYTLSQPSLDASIFGYVKDFCSAQWSASGGTTWDISNGTISPTNTINLSANGTTASNSGTGSRTATLAYKTLSTTSVTGTAKITNNIGGSATSTATVNVQAYSQPIAKSLAVGRVTVNNEKHASMSIGWSVNELNKQSTASQSIRSGAITCTWECEDLSNEGVLFSSGEFDIVSDGDAMTVLTDTATATLVDTSENKHDEYDPDKSFRFTAYITDRIGGTSLTISAILASEFYLICAREGGRGIGFGMVPPDDAMHVNMPATFYDNVEMAGGGVFGDDVSVTGDITASGDVTVQGNSILSTLFYQPNETVVFAGRWAGFITTSSTQVMFQIPLTKSAALVSSATVVNITGGIRISTGGYADNVTDGTSWKGRSGISFNAPVFYGNKGFLGIVMTKSSAFKQNGTTTNVVNNTPLCLGGNIEIKFT